MDFKTMKTSQLFLRYVIPQMIGLIVNSIYFIVDGIFIGQRLGQTALAAAGIAVPVVEIMIAFSMLLSVGTGVLISSAKGRGEHGLGREIFNISIKGTLGIILIIAIAGTVFARPLALFLGAGPTTIQDTTTYLQYFIAFSPFLVMSFALSTYARNDGKPTLAMWSLLIGSISNIILDYLFMYPLNMGMAGAALATGLGPVFSVLILLPHFLKKNGTLFFQKVKYRGSLMVKIIKMGLPQFIMEFSIGLVTLLYNLAIVRNGLGDAGLAAYIVMGYAALICLTAFLGAAQGIQPAVSYYLGAKLFDKIKPLLNVTIVFNVAISIGMYIALYFGGSGFYQVFLNHSPELVHYTVESSRVYFLNLPFAAVNILLISFMQSMEHSSKAMIVSLLRSTLPLFAALLILPLIFGANSIWSAITVAEVLTLAVGLLLWRKIWAIYSSRYSVDIKPLQT